MNKRLFSIVSEIMPSDQKFYFNFGEDAQSDITERLLMIFDTEGIALGAPYTIDITQHKNIPLLWLQLSSTLRNWQVVEKRNSFLIISDMITNAITVKYAYAGEPKRFDFRNIPVSSEGNRPTAPDGFTSSADLIDCRAVLGNPALSATTLAVTMTQYDWVSNTAQIHLVDSTENTPDIPKIPESVSRQIYNGYKAAAQNVKDSALFSPSLKPPAITQNGISVDVPQKVAKKDHRWMIHGSIRVPVALGAMVNRSEMHTASSDAPCAIITAMIIVNKLDNREPSWITLKLPVNSTCKADDIVDVSFSADLKQFNEEFADAGVYQVYVACGAFVAGPFALEVTR